MILYIDIQKTKNTVGIIGARKAEWVTSASRGGVYALLEKVDVRFGIFTKRPTAIVVASGSEGRDVSWSSVRTGVAVANTLAFTWKASVSEISLDVGDTNKEIATKVRRAAKQVTKKKWLKATYSGEPNITKAKPVF